MIICSIALACTLEHHDRSAKAAHEDEFQLFRGPGALMSEKGSTLRRDPTLPCEREQRSEGRLILASIRNLNALPTEELRIDSHRAQAM
jgi:hypothetical protein